MNPLVERAQRAYGSYLAAQGGPQAGSLWLEAQNAYLAVLDSARNGLADAMYEIARLLTEPETAASLGLEKADLLMALPDSWIPTVLSTSNLSTSDLLKVAFASTGEGCSVVLDRLLSQADQENDVEGLTAVLTLGNSQQRQQALVLLGHRIYLKGHEHLAASGLDPQEWVRQSDRFLQAVAEWIDAARSNGLEGSEYLRQLHQLSDHVEGRRTREEVNWILNALSRMFLTSFADLRRWDADLEHLCRRGEELLLRSGSSLDPQLARRLREECERARFHGRNWAVTQGAGKWQINGRSFPSPPGSCPHCAAWTVVAEYCTQCGAPFSGQALPPGPGEISTGTTQMTPQPTAHPAPVPSLPDPQRQLRWNGTRWEQI